MKDVLVVAGPHAGQIARTDRKRSQVFSLVEHNPVGIGTLGRMAQPEDFDPRTCHYIIHELRHLKVDRVWWLAMPVGDDRDPLIVTMDYLMSEAIG